jgi:hypothetical protein
MTALHIAAHDYQLAAFERLVDKGADINAEDTVRSQLPLRRCGNSDPLPRLHT